MPPRHRPAAQLPTSYAKATFIFVILATVIAGGALYLALSRTTITVTPRIQTTTIRFSATVQERSVDSTEPLPKNVLAGQILATSIKDADTFTAQGTGTKTPAQATGTVTIYNNWSQVQPLAATTRFMSESGVLFRLRERTDVPPGGSVTAEVYADEAGESGNIGPTRFTLPGLWPGLRDKIYAESTASMTGGIVELKTISAEDLSKAKAALTERAIEKARTEFQTTLNEQTERYALLDESLTGTPAGSEYSAEVGEAVDEFTAELTVSVEAIAFASDSFDQLVQEKIKEETPDNSALLSLTMDDPIVKIARVNPDTKTAELNVEGTVQTSVTLEDPLFNRATLKNRDRQSILNYFSTFEEVKSVDVHFSPFWATRTQSLEDHIEIKLTDPE